MKNITATRKGLITGLLVIGLTLFFFYGLKMPLFGKEQYAIYAVYTAGILWSLFSFRRNAGGDKKFKDYFSTGFKTFIVVTLLMAVFTFIFFTFVDKSYRDAGITENNALLLQQGNHTPLEIEKNTEQLKKIFMPMMLGIATFKYLFLGVLITAVGGGFLGVKRENV